jgi:ribosomal protein S6E (S10)
MRGQASATYSGLLRECVCGVERDPPQMGVTNVGRSAAAQNGAISGNLRSGRDGAGRSLFPRVPVRTRQALQCAGRCAWLASRGRKRRREARGRATGKGIMSVPIRDEDGSEHHWRGAPHRAPPLPPAGEPFARAVSAPPIVPGEADAMPSAPGSVHAPPAMPSGVGGPNIELPPWLRSFEGDIAIMDLRRRLALDPDLVPQPPLPRRRWSGIAWIGRWLFVLLAAATVGFTITVLTAPRAPRQDGGAGTVVAPEHRPRAARPLPAARLVVEGQHGFANEPIPLGVWVDRAAGGEMLTLLGLVSGTRLSAGAPLGSTGWQVSARDLGNALAYAPRDFVGVMQPTADLRSARDRIVDSQLVRLEWLPKTEPQPAPNPEPPVAAAPALDPEEVATLTSRAEDFLRNGDIVSARISLRRAVQAGDAQAALTLGLTFDPTFLTARGVLGFAPDVPEARRWYQRAIGLGSTEATRRLERLPPD